MILLWENTEAEAHTHTNINATISPNVLHYNDVGGENSLCTYARWDIMFYYDQCESIETHSPNERVPVAWPRESTK